MQRPNDEILMAYADGQLSDLDAAHVKDYLLSDPSTQEFVNAMSRTAELARRACNIPEATYVPPALLSYVLNAQISAETASSETGNVVNFLSHKPSKKLSASRWYALAASITLAIGIAASGVFQSKVSDTWIATGPIEPTTPLANLLESHVSGDSLSLAGHGSESVHASVASTFMDAAQRPCREIEVLSGAETKNPIAAAISCRSADGKWAVEGSVNYSSSEIPSSKTSYVPSGQESSHPLDHILDRLGAQSALSADDEKVLIDKGWK